MCKLKLYVKWMHSHYSSYTSKQKPHQTRLLVWQMAFFFLIWNNRSEKNINSSFKKKHPSFGVETNPWNFSRVHVICYCHKLLFKKAVKFREKDTLIIGVRDKAPSSHYGIFSNTITHPLTKILRLDNGAMKSCSTMHNCSFWNIDEWN